MTSTATPPWVLALGGTSHDYSAAIARDGDILAAVEEERLNRTKYGTANWYLTPAHRSVRYCLDAAGITERELSAVVSSDLLPQRVRDAYQGHDLRLYGHHRTHAASVCAMLPPDSRAAIIVYDGMGSIKAGAAAGIPAPAAERETFSFFRAEGGTLERLGGSYGTGALEHMCVDNSCTNSIGLLYELVTGLLGFGLLEAGKTMGLAAWGSPRYLDVLQQHATIGDSMDTVLDFDPGRGIVAELTEILDRHNHSFAVQADLAASVQRLTEDVLLRCYELIAQVDADVIGIAGGCALNTVANGKLAQRLPGHQRLLVPPCAGDSGVGVGALWLYLNETSNAPASMTVRGKPAFPGLARPGRVYTLAERAQAVTHHYPRLVREPAFDSLDALAGQLAAGKLVGFFNGGSEIGPRALGGRSILSDPRDSLARERLNRDIKHREPFRPLAPMVLAEHFAAYFQPDVTRDYFMLTVAAATAHCKTTAPAVVHIDGTARTQTVDDTSDPVVAALLREFYARTGVPVLLNTSFNSRGEPIVESPSDAIGAFLRLGLDILWLDGEAYLAAASSAHLSSQDG